MQRFRTTGLESAPTGAVADPGSGRCCFVLVIRIEMDMLAKRKYSDLAHMPRIGRGVTPTITFYFRNAERDTVTIYRLQANQSGLRQVRRRNE